MTDIDDAGVNDDFPEFDWTSSPSASMGWWGEPWETPDRFWFRDYTLFPRLDRAGDYLCRTERLLRRKLATAIDPIREDEWD